MRAWTRSISRRGAYATCLFSGRQKTPPRRLHGARPHLMYSHHFVCLSSHRTTTLTPPFLFIWSTLTWRGPLFPCPTKRWKRRTPCPVPHLRKLLFPRKHAALVVANAIPEKKRKTGRFRPRAKLIRQVLVRKMKTCSAKS